MSGEQERPDDDRAPISWDALAAELSATRQEAERRGDADPETWDAVAAALAARVSEQPVEDVPVAPVPEEPPPPEDPTPPDVRAGEPAPEEAEPEEPLELLGPEELRGGLEALLFVMDDPVDEATLAGALRCDVAQVASGLADLAESYDERRAGITLRRVGEGWRLYTRDEHAPVVERYLVDGQKSRLTQAALETLAVIAYRQPVTRARISGIRGVGVDGVMRTLITRGLVHEVGTDPDSGGGLYATTPLFLERLGLTSLADLPELAPLLPETATMLDEHPDSLSVPPSPTEGRGVRSMPSVTSPGVVLVHGLWHGAWYWDAVRALLTERGIPSAAVELPLTDLIADVRTTRDALDDLGRPAVLVGHSYGGAVITAAGDHPLVRELVYLAAFQLDEGESVGRTRPGRNLPDTRLPQAMRVTGDDVGLDPELGMALLYGDAPPAVASAAAARLRPVHRLVFRGVPDVIAWRDVPSTYVVCTEDQVVHPELQRAMAARATRTIEWPCGHSPVSTRPESVSDLIAARVQALAGP